MRPTISDHGSTLVGLDVRVLGVILTVALLVVLAYDYWRRFDEARRDKAREDAAMQAERDYDPDDDPMPEHLTRRVQDELDRAWRDRHES